MVLLLGPSGCSLAFDYGDPAAESTADACADGVDNDLDGRSDCRDPDCALLCREDDAAACADGRDNDGDGVTDCADPDCGGSPSCAEATAALCGNGFDDDADTLVDCADPDCDGLCPERSVEACADGRDNDGDGRTDGADATCWPSVALSVERCASIGQTLLTAELGDRDAVTDAFYATGPSPVELGTHPVVGAASTLPDGLTLGTVSTFAGPVDGLSLSLIARLDQGDWGVSLAPAVVTPIGTPSSVAMPLIDVRRNGSQLVLSADGISEQTDLTGANGWYTLVLTGTAQVLSVTLSPLPGAGSGPTIDLGSVSVDDPLLPELRVLLTGEMVLARLDLSVPEHSPCGPAVPSLDGGDPTVDQLGSTVAVTGSSVARWCTMLPFRRGEPPRTYVSDDGLAWQWTGWSSDVDADRIAVALAWDGAAYQAVELTSDGTFLRSSSTDCALWTPSGAFETPAPRPSAATGSSSLSYVIRGEVHEIYWTERIADAHWLVVSRADLGAGFGFGDVEPVALLDEAVDDGVQITTVGEDLVMVYTGAALAGVDGLGLRVETAPGDFVDVRAGAVLSPSRLPRTFDRSSLLAGSLAVRGEQVLLLYSAIGDYAQIPSPDGSGASAPARAVGSAWLRPR